LAPELFKIGTYPRPNIAQESLAEYQGGESGRTADFPHSVGRA
jgi:hypothetical protein